MPVTKQSPKSSRKSKGLLVGGIVTVGLALAGGAAWFFTRKNEPSTKDDLLLADTQTPTPDTSSDSKPSPKWNPAQFPLRRGMRGAAITQLQQALVRKHGNVLPRYGADGDFGGETESALRNNGWPVLIEQATFSKIIAGASSNQASQIVGEVDAKVLARAINGKDVGTIGKILARMNTIADYSKVSNHLKRETTYNRLGLGASRNLANALMGDTMSWNFATRQSFAGHLKRMGLKHDQGADRWSLSGIPALGMVPALRVWTIENTMAWDGGRSWKDLPARVYVGRVQSSGNGVIKVITPEGNDLYLYATDVKVG